MRSLAVLLILTGAASAQGATASDVLSALYYPCVECRPISCANIVRDAYGTRTWIPGMVNFGSRTVRESRDGRCIGCWKERPPGGKPITIGMCLMLPKGMT